MQIPAGAARRPLRPAGARSRSGPRWRSGRAGELLFAFSPSFGVAIAGPRRAGRPPGDACMFLNVLRVAAALAAAAPLRAGDRADRRLRARSGQPADHGRRSAPRSAASAGPRPSRPPASSPPCLANPGRQPAAGPARQAPPPAVHAPILPTLRRAWRAAVDPPRACGCTSRSTARSSRLTGPMGVPRTSFQGQGRLACGPAAAMLTASVVAFGVAAAPRSGQPRRPGLPPPPRGTSREAGARSRRRPRWASWLAWPGHPPLPLVDADAFVLSGVSGAGFDARVRPRPRGRREAPGWERRRGSSTSAASAPRSSPRRRSAC